VQPWRTLERATAPDGTELVLAQRGGEWVLRAGGRVLMSSRVHASEDALAAIALRRWAAAGRGEARAAPRTVLLGGLGLGFTLRALLDRVPARTRVVVAELVPELTAWVRGPAAHLAGRPLDDPRVRLQIGSVEGRISEASGAFDLVLLDVDNGASALVHRRNDHLYRDAGVRACHRALRGSGVLAVWSARPDPSFLETLERAGFEAEEHVAPAGAGKGLRHAILLGVKGRGAPWRTGPVIG
jgi:spermidine synthase